MGLSAAAAGARHNLGYVLASSEPDPERLVEARALEERAIEAFEAYGSPRMAGASRMYLAAIAYAAGDLDRAEADARAAVDLLSTVPPLHPQALATLARVLLARGHAEEALALAGSAIAALGSQSRPESGEARIRLMFAEALAAVGRAAEAASAIAEARAALLARAQKIADPTLRDRFLSAVPDNARTLALARVWSDIDPAPPTERAPHGPLSE
jgi:tetratricopeptide (TPR) repeat protein